MLKEKFLHRKSRKTRHSHHWDIKKYNRGKNIDLLYDELPQRANINRGHGHWSNIDTDPLKNFLETKIGCLWDDVYSEIIKKTKKKFRREIDNSIECYVFLHSFYDEDYLPYAIPRYSRAKVLNDQLFINLDGILVKKTMEELLHESKRLLRQEKLRRILENQERKEIEDQESSS